LGGIPSGTVNINVFSASDYTLAFGDNFWLSGTGAGAWALDALAFNLTNANVVLNDLSQINLNGVIALNSASGNSLTINGTVANSGSRTIGAIVNSGVLNLNNTQSGSGGPNWGFFVYLNDGTLNLNNNAIANNSAIVMVQDRAGFRISGGVLDNQSGSAKTLTASPTLMLNGDFAFSTGAGTSANDVNLGTGAASLGTAAGATRTITVNGSATLTIGGAIADGTTANSLTKAGTGTLKLTGTSTFSGDTTVSAGTLNASGALAGNLVNNGAVQVGDGVATLAVGGDYSQGSGKPLRIAMNGGAGSCGRMTAAGTASLAGSLVVTNLGSGAADGQSFTVLVAQAISGTFDSVTLPSLIAGYSWTTSYDATQVVLTVFSSDATCWWNADGIGEVGGAGAWDLASPRWNRPNSNSTVVAWTNMNPSILYALFSGPPGVVTVQVGTVHAFALDFHVPGYSIASNTINFNGLSSGLIALSNGASATIASLLAGTNGLRIAASNATLTLQGTNTFSGGLAVLRGTVAQSGTLNFNGFGATDQTITLGAVNDDHAALQLNDRSGLAQYLFVEGSGRRMLVGTHDNAAEPHLLNRRITLIGADLNLQATGAAPVRLAAGVSGTGNLIVTNTGAGPVEFQSVAISHTGSVRNAGTGTGGIVDGAGGTFGRGVTSLIQASPTAPWLISQAHTSFVGSVLVSAGTLYVSHSNALHGSNTAALASGASLVISNVSLTLAGLNDAVVAGGLVTNTADTTDRLLTLSGSGAYSNSAVLAGHPQYFSVLKTGSGTQALAGASTFRGATTIRNGELVLAGAGSLASTTIVIEADALLSGNAGFTLASGQELYFSILAEERYGKVRATGPVDLSAGVLTAVITNDYESILGRSFTVLVASAVSGRFAATNLPDFGGNRTFTVEYTATNVVLVGSGGGPTFWWNADGAGGLGGAGSWTTNVATWHTPLSNGLLMAWENLTYDSAEAIFAGDSGTVTVNADGPVHFNRLSMLTTGYVITDGNLNLVGYKFPAVTLGNGVTAAVASAISSSITNRFNLSASTNGLLILSASNTFDNAVTLSNGTLRLGNAYALGSTNGPTFIRSGATLDLNGQTMGDAFGDSAEDGVAGTGVGNIGAIINSSSSGAIATNTIHANSSFSVGGSGDIRFGTITKRTMSAPGIVVTLNNAGTIVLTNNDDNAYLNLTINTGTVFYSAAATGRKVSDATIINGGLVRFITAGGFQGNIEDSYPVTLNGGTLDLNGFSETIAGFSGSGGIAMSVAPARLTIGTANGGGTYDGALDGALSLTKLGTATSTLNGVNTTVGTNFISGGLLRVNGSFPASVVSTINGGYLGGSGTLGGSVNLQSGGIDAGTTVPGVLSLGALGFTSGTFRVDISNSVGTAGWIGI
jgi:fibronectin-binding autotransporter adhesin